MAWRRARILRDPQIQLAPLLGHSHVESRYITVETVLRSRQARWIKVEADSAVGPERNLQNPTRNIFLLQAD